MKEPTLTPAQALAALRVKTPQTIAGVYYYLDGPQNCPSELLFPVARIGENYFVPTGELGTDPKNSTWFKCPF